MTRYSQRAAGRGVKTRGPSPRRALALLLALPLFATAQAAPPAGPVSQVLACRLITADAARLTCFDRASAALAAVPVASHPRAAGPATPAMREALDPQRTFGLPHATIVRREAAAAGVRVQEAPNITARILRMGSDPDGRAILDLDNGQVWEQLVADGSSLYTKPGDTVRISRGWLGSYWLEAPSHHGCKVTRLR